MFTLDQIREAHAKVKSGADFPRYIQDLIVLGVQKYDTFVHDGHGEYFGEDGSMLISSPKYDTLTIADTSNKEVFTKQLRAHQQGQTDYMTFCQESANAGIEKWTVDTITLTCTYYDKKGKLILTENIPNKTQEMLVRFFSLLFIGYGIWGMTKADFYVFGRGGGFTCYGPSAQLMGIISLCFGVFFLVESLKFSKTQKKKHVTIKMIMMGIFFTLLPLSLALCFGFQK